MSYKEAVEDDCQDFIDTMNTQLVLFAKVLHHINTKSKETLASDPQFNDFINDYPKLYAGILSGMVDMEQLIRDRNVWLSDYTKASGNHQQRKFAADKIAGKILARKYLSTSGDNSRVPTKKDYSRAEALVQKKVDKTVFVKKQQK